MCTIFNLRENKIIDLTKLLLLKFKHLSTTLAEPKGKNNCTAINV